MGSNRELHRSLDTAPVLVHSDFGFVLSSCYRHINVLPGRVTHLLCLYSVETSATKININRVEASGVLDCCCCRRSSERSEDVGDAMTLTECAGCKICEVTIARQRAKGVGDLSVG